MEEARQRQHQRNLHQFGRLQVQRAYRNPALRTKPDMAHHIDRDQKQQGNGVGRIGQAHPHANIDHRRGHQHHQAQGEMPDLPKRPGLETRPRHGIEHGDAGDSDHADQQHQAPIYFRQLLGQRQGTLGGGIGTKRHHPPAFAGWGGVGLVSACCFKGAILAELGTG